MVSFSFTKVNEKDSGGGLREAGYPNAPQSKMLGGKMVVLPPRFLHPVSVRTRHNE